MEAKDLYDKIHSEIIKRVSENNIKLNATFELTENEFNQIMRSKEVLLRGELYNMIYPIQMDYSPFPKKIEFKLIKKP